MANVFSIKKKLRLNLYYLETFYVNLSRILFILLETVEAHISFMSFIKHCHSTKWFDIQSNILYQ